ncbi:MAG: hypothetical protein ABL984_18470 [Pyrinomonadaceae bacterium]
MISAAAAAINVKGRTVQPNNLDIDHARSPQNGHQISNRFNRIRQRLHAFCERGRATVEVLNLRSACAII